MEISLPIGAKPGYPAWVALARGWEMGASMAQSSGRGLNLEDALAHLEQALEILDAKKVSPDVGARLQEVIDQLRASDPS